MPTNRDTLATHLEALERRYREQFASLDDLLAALRRSDQALRQHLVQLQRPT